MLKPWRSIFSLGYVTQRMAMGGERAAHRLKQIWRRRCWSKVPHVIIGSACVVIEMVVFRLVC